MKSFCIVTNGYKDKNCNLAKKISQYIMGKGAKCITLNNVDYDTGKFRVVQKEELPEDVQCVISIGGDGTLLHTAKDLLSVDAVFVGVNKGTLGFLAEISHDDIEHAIDKLLCDDFNVESRMMLEGSVMRDGKVVYSSTVLNDIIIHRGGDLCMSSFNVYVNGQLLGMYNADGIILSTPTGSTAYNLSAGGPVARPDSHMIILTPICPHTMANRSILLSRNDKIEVEIGDNRVQDGENRKLTFDGDSVFNIMSGDVIKICEAPQITKIAKLDEGSFLQTIKDKLE